MVVSNRNLLFPWVYFNGVKKGVEISGIQVEGFKTRFRTMESVETPKVWGHRDPGARLPR